MARITSVLRNRWYMSGLALWLVSWQLHSIYTPKLGLSVLFSHGAYDAILFFAAATCAARWLRFREERGAWLFIAAAICIWTLGDVYFTIFLWNVQPTPVPSFADIGYLMFVPLMLIGLAKLARRRLRGVPRVLWIDGIIAALSIASISAAIVFDAILKHATGAPLQIATNLAYPLTDLLLLAVTVGAIASSGWHFDRTWLLFSVGLIVFIGADSTYLVQVAENIYKSGGILDAGWSVGIYIIALASVQRPAKIRKVADDNLRLVSVPLAFGAIALALLVSYAASTHVNALAIGLATSCLVAVMGRLHFTFRENIVMLRESRLEAKTDALTGLGNRRALTSELEQLLETADDANPLMLVLFDLDGFKHYNDTFGHPSGDGLLARLAGQLKTYLSGRGMAYRMGGDEFCAVFFPGAQVAEPIIAGAANALSEHGNGFSIGCSYGSILLPHEANNATDALRVADRRMYAQKANSRMSPGRQSSSVLMRALVERNPELGSHIAGVASLAERTALNLGLSAEDAERVRHAAELHDVGKVAVPDAILTKPGPLDPDEWEFVRRHTLVGERIIAAAPALEPVARLVRSSHERWDGLGYPDGLKGEQIPLGSRIVSVADAFDAMLSNRPYSRAFAVESALTELRRCAGGQFDPVVVEAFCGAWRRGGDLREPGAPETKGVLDS